MLGKLLLRHVYTHTKKKKKKHFPGGASSKNLPANVGDAEMWD